MIKSIQVLIVLIVFFYACEPEEIPISVQGLINYTQVDLGEDYCYQKYYNIDYDHIVGENLNTDWDLAFSNNYNAVILNSSKYMRVIPFNSDIGFTTVEQLIENGEWLYDNPNGNMELLAFNNGATVLSQNYFLVDKGYDCNTDHIGYSIIKILDYNDNTYFIQLVSINNGVWDYSEVIEIQKKESNQHSYFSLNTNSIVNIIELEWDLCFLRYTEFNVLPPSGNDLDPLPTYRVVGVLQNSHVSVAVDSINNFKDITMTELHNYEFSEEQNSIGYDWKYYNSELAIYSIDSPVYIIKTSEHNYYKLLFLDFYNSDGHKGAPMFQIEKIEL